MDIRKERPYIDNNKVASNSKHWTKNPLVRAQPICKDPAFFQTF